MTFVHATYVLTTLVHIKNISAVADPILTKLFAPNFLGSPIFVRQHLFLDQIPFDPNTFLTKYVFD